MDIKRFVWPALSLALVGSVCSAAHAEPFASADPIAASFQRLLDRPPSDAMPEVPAGAVADPLRSAVSAVLWETQPPSFHVQAAPAPISAQPKPGN